MKYLVLALALVCACDDEEAETADVKATKLECHEVLKHIVSLSPQTQGQDAEQVVTALPVEDLQGCVASEPEIRGCMATANDIPAVRACLPANAVLGCMQAASKMKAAAHEKAKKKDPDPVIDKPFDDIRAKAWTDRDAKACDALKKLETTT
jgi:hypothetical protein